MSVLILGLVLFLGTHSVRIVADGWRRQTIARIGASRWKGAYALLSIIGFVLIVYGFGLARHNSQPLYAPVSGGVYIDAVLMLIALIVFASARVPGNHFKAALGHPQAFAVMLWAIGHLLATGMLHDVVLLVPFGCWGAAAFFAGRARDAAAGTTYPAGTLRGDAMCIVGGVVTWALFAYWAHALLIGVKAFG